MFIKTILALFSFSILTLAAPHPQDPPGGDINIPLGMSCLNPCLLGTSLIKSM